MQYCSICEAPQRRVWPPRSDTPAFEMIERVGWNMLARCAVCGALWDLDAQEPYGSFRYYTLWPWSDEAWVAIAREQQQALETSGWTADRVLERWKGAQLWDAARTFTGADLDALRAHQRRSRGLIPEVLLGFRPEVDMSAVVAHIERGEAG